MGGSNGLGAMINNPDVLQKVSVMLRETLERVMNFSRFCSRPLRGRVFAPGVTDHGYNQNSPEIRPNSS
jgi:hypothetical protein